MQTPVDECGNLQEEALKAQLDLLRGKGLAGLLILGSTGCFPFFSLEDRKRIVRRFAEHAPDFPLIVNISDIRLSSVVQLGKTAKDAGAVGVSILPPWFFEYAQSDIEEFLVRGAEAADLPLLLYNFPERTGNRLDFPTISNVVARVPVAAIKHSGADWSYHLPLVWMGQEAGFSVFTGHDSRMSEAFSLGVQGCVSGQASAVPELVMATHREAVKNDPTNGTPEPELRLREIFKLLQEAPFPLNMMAMLDARGIEAGASPQGISATSASKRKRLAVRFSELFTKWGIEKR